MAEKSLEDIRKEFDETLRQINKSINGPSDDFVDWFNNFVSKEKPKEPKEN